jgi:hypothetical protein
MLLMHSSLMNWEYHKMRIDEFYAYANEVMMARIPPEAELEDEPEDAGS